MVAGQLPAANGHDPTQQQQSQQPQELLAQMVPQQPSSIAAEWQKEKQEIMVTVEVLEKHKDWADKKIGQLIKRVTEAERPQKDEAYRLRDEVRYGSSCCAQLHQSFLTARDC